MIRKMTHKFWIEFAFVVTVAVAASVIIAALLR